MKVSKPELSFDARIAGIWGGLDEIVRTADDPDVAMADFFQIKPEQLIAWRTAEGRQRCPGATTRGHVCRNYVSAVVDYDPRAWLSREPQYCPTHARSQQASTALKAPASSPPSSPVETPLPRMT